MRTKKGGKKRVDREREVILRARKGSGTEVRAGWLHAKKVQ
jgi:hypothetical protein